MSGSKDHTTARGLNDVLGVHALVDALRSAVDDERTVERTVHFGTSDGEVDGVVGVRVQTGIAGATVHTRETVGPVQASETDADEVRRPVVDVYDEDDQVRLVAEMPGVGADDLELMVEAEGLVLSADTDRRRYWRAVSLPRPVVGDEAIVEVNEGLVEIVVPAAGADE
jgi:HSP20 family protein